MEHRPIRTPNFFIAGAPKSGSTSLYYALRQHPDVYMSPMKEPSFFATELRPEFFTPELRKTTERQLQDLHIKLASGDLSDDLQGVVTDRTDYQKLFAAAQQERAIGEASVCYLWSATAPRAIAAAHPDAKILLVLRHPAERAYSQYRSYAAAEAKPQSFRKHIEQCLADGETWSACNPLLQFGMYAEQLERYRLHFPQEQIRIWLYEDTVKDPATFLREVFTFLDVDASFVPDTATRYKEVQSLRAPSATRFLRNRSLRSSLRSVVPAALLPGLKTLFYGPQQSIRMNDEDRRYLVSYYRDNVTQLAEMIGKDLSSWLK